MNQTLNELIDRYQWYIDEDVWDYNYKWANELFKYFVKELQLLKDSEWTNHKKFFENYINTPIHLQTTEQAIAGAEKIIKDSEWNWWDSEWIEKIMKAIQPTLTMHSVWPITLKLDMDCIRQAILQNLPKAREEEKSKVERIDKCIEQFWQFQKDDTWEGHVILSNLPPKAREEVETDYERWRREWRDAQFNATQSPET